MKIAIPDKLVNDNIFKCPDCEARIMCFIEDGDTQFCPNCASRNIIEED